MASSNQNQRELPENIRMQLAFAVRGIQWSYGIFWSCSSTQPGVLEWGDGYYNGDIKTRKTVQAAEVNMDHLGLQRSDQLRELFDSLSLGETSPQATRPTAALSPEDLTDAEWYFLVCMSFVFNFGQGLPGRTFAKNEMIWLCNAHNADTKVFSRSLLAKSASFRTVVCFPHLGGVLELGTTELVPEDLNLIQHVKTSFLESSLDSVTKIPNHGYNATTETKNLIYEVLDYPNIPENNLDRNLMESCSPNNNSDDFADNLLRDESNLGEEISNGPNNSLSSSDCVSQTHGNSEFNVPFLDGKKATDNCVQDGQECNQQNHASSCLKGEDVHYQTVLTSLLKSSHQLSLGSCRNGNRESSFTSWNDRRLCSHLPQIASPQWLLKKVLFEVARMHEDFRIISAQQNCKKDDLSKREVDEDRNHVLSERKRREKMNERFTVLGSLVPSSGKVDKVSILDHTIEYLSELERKIEELESYKEATELESTRQGKPRDAIERTSDNYGQKKIENFKKLLLNKRKPCDAEKMGADNKRVHLSSSVDTITVSVNDKDVLIEVRCLWRESVLVEVMEVLTKLHLQSQTVQSSNTDGNSLLVYQSQGLM
nr:MYC5 [Pogostemon cablin]